MRKKKRLALLALVSMLVLAIAVGAGTMALFTDTERNTNNMMMSAGKIDVGTSSEPMYYTGKSHPRDKWKQQYDLPQAIAPYGGEAPGYWAPGDSIPREMDIVNSGKVNVAIKGVHARINMNPTPGDVRGLPMDTTPGSSYQQFIDKMYVKIVDRNRGEAGGLLFNGTLRQLLNTDSGGSGGWSFTNEQIFVVPAGTKEGEQMIDFLVTMDRSAGNDLQNKTWVFDFVFTGEQHVGGDNNDPENGTVTGNVKDDKGTPIEGAKVEFGTNNYDITDENGNYSITVPAGNARTGKAYMSGYNEATQTVNVPAGETVKNVDFILTPLATTGEVYGTVRDLNGNPIVGAKVTVENGVTITTGAGGSYSVILPAGTYNLEASAVGYLSSGESPVTLAAGQRFNLEFALMLNQGTVQGFVKNASTKQGIEGAEVQFGSYIATTGNDGRYSIVLPAGDYNNVTATANGYNMQSQSINVDPNTTKQLDFELTATNNNLGVTKIVLTWKDKPDTDLDAHLFGPGQNENQPFHVYYGNLEHPNDSPQVRLLGDGGKHIKSPGWKQTTPHTETIFIDSQNSGSYRYYVAKPEFRDSNENPASNPGQLKNSKAQVEVYQNGILVNTFNVPHIDGDIWYVFEMNGGIITTKDRMLSKSDSIDVIELKK